MGGPRILHIAFPLVTSELLTSFVAFFNCRQSFHRVIAKQFGIAGVIKIHLKYIWPAHVKVMYGRGYPKHRFG